MASLRILFLLFSFFFLSFSQITLAGNVTTHHLQPRGASASMTTLTSTSPSPQKRVVTSFCDGYARNFFCVFPETCYTGIDGYIGCCTSASSCAARTCIDFTAGFSPSCEYFTGGCMYCSNAQSPYCGAVTNVLASQYAPYCGTDSSYSTMSYVNPITTGSIASLPGPPGPSPASLTSSMPQSTTRTFLQSVSPGASTSASDTSISGWVSVHDAQSASPTTFTISQQFPPATGPTGGASSSSTASASAPMSSPSAIAGLIIGCAGGTVLILAMIYLLIRQLARRSTTLTATRYEHRGDYSEKAEDDGYAREAEPVELAGESVESNGVRQQRTSYHCVNPDPLPAGQCVRGLEDMVSPVSGVAEAPTDRPLHSAPVSPAATSTSSPYLPSPSSNSLATPTTPDRGGPLSNHPTHTRPLASTPRGPRRYVPYTPSVYTSSGQAPSSLPRDAQGPTMVQSYSVVELHGESSPQRQQSTPQGLGISMRGERPWQYLSAEDALADGLRDEGRSVHDRQ